MEKPGIRIGKAVAIDPNMRPNDLNIKEIITDGKDTPFISHHNEIEAYGG